MENGVHAPLVQGLCGGVSRWPSVDDRQLGYDPLGLPAHPLVSFDEQSMSERRRHTRQKTNIHLPLKKRRVRVIREDPEDREEVAHEDSTTEDHRHPSFTHSSTPSCSFITPVHHTTPEEQPKDAPGRDAQVLPNPQPRESSITVKPSWTPGDLIYFHHRVHHQQNSERVSKPPESTTSMTSYRVNLNSVLPKSLQLGKDGPQDLLSSQKKNALEAPSCSDIENQRLEISPVDELPDQHAASEATQALARPNQCPDCPASFPSTKQLQRHRNSHDNPKGRPHECQVCSATFAFPNNLRIHLLSHSGEKPFECPECQRRFTLRRYLDRHVRVHTGERPFKCQECGANFAQYANLWHHRRIHTGELPYECRECGKRFRGSSHLKRHVRSHTGERPYVCPSCPNLFTTWDALQRHKISAHGAKPKDRVVE